MSHSCMAAPCLPEYILHSKVTVDRLSQAVTSGRLYAILSAGNDRLVLAKLETLGSEQAACLERGRRAIGVLAETAPYLLRLDVELLEWIRTTQWHRHWGFFLVSAAPFRTLTRHFGKFLFVTLPNGQRRRFHFHAPAILPAFLASCDASETKEFFGPCESLWVFSAGAGEGEAFERAPALAEVTPIRRPVGQNFLFRDRHLRALRLGPLSTALQQTLAQSDQQAHRDPQTDDVLIGCKSDPPLRIIFDTYGNLGCIVSPHGRQWKTSHDPSNGHFLGVTTPSGMRLTTHVKGDATEILRNGKLCCVEHRDELGRLVRIDYPDRTSRRIDYRFSTHDRLGAWITATTNRLGHREAYRYDHVGDIESLTDARGQSTRYTYGKRWNRPIKITYADGIEEHLTYTTKGQLAQIRTDDAWLDFNYTETDHLAGFSGNGGTRAHFEWDCEGRITAAHSPEARLHFRYDEMGRLEEERLGSQSLNTIRYHYDDKGLSALTYPGKKSVGFEHDADGRLIKVTDWHGDQYRIEYGSDDKSWRLTTPHGVVLNQIQNDAGFPLRQTVSGHDKLLGDRQNEYDQEDRLSSCIDHRLGTSRYAYDAESQILSVEGPHAESFAYDPAGNRTEANGAITAFDSVNHPEDAQYDTRGNLIAHGVWQYTYNVRNQLIRAETHELKVTYGYDTFGRRLWKRAERLLGGRLQRRETRTIWSGESRLQETVTEQWFEPGSGVSFGGPQTLRSDEYLYWPGTTTPLILRRTVPLKGSQIYLYETDHRGAPIRLYDMHGKIVWEAHYRAYGLAVVSVEIIEQSLRLPGQVYDAETGLHENRFRYYDPLHGIYLSRDPLGVVNGLHLYRYAQNDPINKADPLGLFSFGGFLKAAVPIVAAAAVGLAAGILLAPIAAPLAILTAGALAGATFAGLNEYLNQQEFCTKCIGIAALKGAAVGAVAAVPFAFLPATAGAVAFAGAGGLSGAIGYAGDCFSNNSPWSWPAFALAVGLGGMTAGASRWVGGRFAARAKSNPPSSKANTVPHPGPVNFMEHKDRFYLNASKRTDVDPDGVFDVVAHGSSRKIQVETANGPVLVNHRVAARLIKQADGYNGQAIRLLSCETGASDTGFAQNLANKLGVTVHAPNELLWAHSDGRMVVAPMGQYGPNLSAEGSFRTFTPKSPVPGL